MRDEYSDLILLIINYIFNKTMQLNSLYVPMLIYIYRMFEKFCASGQATYPSIDKVVMKMF